MQWEGSKKIAIDSATVGEFLQTNFHKRAACVSWIGSGLFSQAFSFTVEQQAFVFRLNAWEEDFQKDAFACDRFSTPALPIPRVVRIGRFDETQYFAIAERCEGQTIQVMDELQVRNVIAELFNALDIIHGIDISTYTGWGLTNAVGNGLFETWQDYLLSLYNQKFVFDWSKLIQHTFLEQDVYEAFLEAMKQLLPYCPLEKYLVHGDFGFDNVISDGKQITGVLDWAESRLGDFVYDIAYLDFWSEDIPYGALWREDAASRGRDVLHFEERMQCYMLHIGLGSLAIAAIKGDEEDYIWVRERTRSVWQSGSQGSTIFNSLSDMKD